VGVQPSLARLGRAPQGRAPAHIAPQMVGRPQARASFTHAPGSSPSRIGIGSQPAAVRPARNTLSDGGDYTAAAAATADASEVVETSKQAQQRRLMSLQVDAALHCMPSLSTTYG
jgi:hypothetical protein